MRLHVIRAVFKRNFVAHFTSPTGYLFITLFILICSIAQFMQETFFAALLANLAPLNAVFHWLLIFFVPTITMSTWADERRHGTDELLLTLPVRDLELVLGKFLAASGIYTVSLAFSLSLVAAVASLGKPDFGVIFGTYLGYWLLGCALLSVGMVASVLTSSMTVAFILGAVFTSTTVFLSYAELVLPRSIEGYVAVLGALDPFHDLTSGVLTLQSAIYFVALAIAMLYVNLALLARRHVAGGPRSAETWLHLGTRAACLLVAGVSLTVLAGRFGSRLDLTEERLHSLTRETRELLYKIDANKPVMIQAYVSTKVPRSYVEPRETLLGLLREYGSIGGSRIQYRVVDVEPFSAEARDAEERFGIRPVKIPEEQGGRASSTQVHLGVAVTCGAEETVVPFLHKGFSIEYELTRSIGVVIGAERKKIGIATTDAKLMGGMNFENFQRDPSWQIVDELKKQYEVTEVSLDQPIEAQVDALLVVMPSSLTQVQMNHLAAYIRSGRGVLLMDDPFPAWNMRLAPGQPKGGGRSPFGGPPSAEQKGDIDRLLREFGVVWNKHEVVWGDWNPIPKYEIPNTIVFIGSDSGAEEPFNAGDVTTSGLQLIASLWGGHVTPVAGPLKFVPLLRTGKTGGTVTFDDLQALEPGQEVERDSTGLDYVMGARVSGKLGTAASVNLVFIPDADMMSDLFFRFRREGHEDFDFDNVTFLLNCIDTLTRDESYIAVRKRQPKHRTLTRFEERAREHTKKLREETAAAKKSAKQKLEEAQARFKAKVGEIEGRTDVDDQTKLIMVTNVREVEQRRLETEQKRIEDEKKAAVERSQVKMEQAILGLQKAHKWLSVLLTPLPALFIGLLVLVFRTAGERGPA